jgi:hypothetical protein
VDGWRGGEVGVRRAIIWGACQRDTRVLRDIVTGGEFGSMYGSDIASRRWSGTHIVISSSFLPGTYIRVGTWMNSTVFGGQY